MSDRSGISNSDPVARAVMVMVTVILSAGTLRAQFSPSVTTQFDVTTAGQTSDYSQDLLFLTGQEGPSDISTSIDKGSFDFNGLVVGDLIGGTVVTISLPAMFPFPAISGTVDADIVVTNVSTDSVESVATVTSITTALLPVLVLLGVANPVGQSALDVNLTDLPGDSGVSIVVTDNGTLPIASAAATIDIPISTTLSGLFVQSPSGGSVEITTTITSSSGASSTTVETVTLIGGSAPEFLRGDVDANGSYGLPDVVAALSFQFAGGTPPPCESAADFDDNGTLALADVVSLLAYLFQSGANPAPPSVTACGVDPTPDSLNCSTQPSCP